MKSIKEQRDIIDAATPGEWVRGKNLGTVVSKSRPTSAALSRCLLHPLNLEYYGGYLIAESTADVDFIVNARSDYPKLLDWAKRARLVLCDVDEFVRESSIGAAASQLLKELPE